MSINIDIILLGDLLLLKLNTIVSQYFFKTDLFSILAIGQNFKLDYSIK